MLKKIKNTLKNIWQDESGQGATEYILMLVVVVAIAFAFRGRIMDIITKQTDNAGGKLRGAIDNIGASQN